MTASIKNRLIRIILQASITSLVLAMLFVTLFDMYAFRRDAIETAVLISRVAGDYSVTELAFNNREESVRTLSRLRTIPHLEGVAIYDEAGDLFSSYSAGDVAPPPSRMTVESPLAWRFSGGSLHVVRPIYHDGMYYGIITVRLSTSPLFSKILNHLALLLALAAVIVIITILVATRLQRQISGPILKLAETAREISGKGDYSIRVEKSGNDEIAGLCDAFNSMLDQVQSRQAERDNAIGALMESEGRFRSLIDQSNDPLFVLENFRIVFVNPRFTAYMGYSPNEVISGGFNILNLIAPEIRHKVVNLIRRMQRGDRVPNQYDLKGITKDGAVIDFEVNFSFIEWNGKPGILGMLRDITSRKKAEEDLRKKQEELASVRMYLQNIIDSMPSLLIGVNPDMRVTQWNSEATRVTGIRQEDALGKEVMAVYPFIAPYEETVRLVLATGNPRKEERIAVPAGEDTLYADLMVYPLSSENIDGAVIRVDDVTARVKIEQMMLQTEKVMSVGGLAAGMAHEINNPLGGILMGAQNFRRRLSPGLDKNTEVAREAGTSIEAINAYMEKRGLVTLLDGIQEMGERASGIVQNMLNFSRRSESKITQVDLRELMEKTLELAANDYDLKKKYDFRHMEIVREFGEDLPPVPCYPQEIEQVILNLVKNAAQALGSMDAATRPERPRIVLRLLARGDTAQIEVEDNGPGMDEKTKAKVFEPFFTTKKSGEGTGLGLSVSCHIIINNHKGDIRLETAPGKGAKFIITLPLTRN